MAPLTYEDKILTKKQPRSKSCGLLSVGSLWEMVYCHKISDTDQLKRVLNC